MTRSHVLSMALLALVACSSSTPPSHPPIAPAGDGAIERVATIHGGAGPWVVAGYRMGEYARTKLGLERGSFDVEVVHFTPHEVQYSCIADGAAAATGASLGKLNLTLSDAPAPETRTTYRRKSTGQAITLRVTKGFASRYSNVPREKLREAGREVMTLRDEDVFEEVHSGG
ncbi:formylmethanofuran dehydrogenase subunit E family protein [Pendulispora rubella]|uniref:Formylmethanofuran dehydrogenase subunit E family protein n=1 Tax=Pendulispora rubella TaxID=2741070 RepID=A0ABZ2L7L7_9BACT